MKLDRGNTVASSLVLGVGGLNACDRPTDAVAAVLKSRAF